MHEVQLTEQLYKEARRRATQAGFSSVDEYVADVVNQDLHEPVDDFDYVFTPERIAHLDRISAEIKSGAKTFTMAEVKEHFEKKREAWLKKHTS